MSLFDMAYLLSPVGGAVGTAMAAHERSPSHPAILIVGIAIGLVCGHYFYRGLMRLVTWKAETPKDMTSWRAAALLGAGFTSPYLAAFVCFWLASLILYFAASYEGS
jgi:xanthosine utilization system XapX-like protein